MVKKFLEKFGNLVKTIFSTITLLTRIWLPDVNSHKLSLIIIKKTFRRLNLALQNYIFDYRMMKIRLNEVVRNILQLQF